MLIARTKTDPDSLRFVGIILPKQLVLTVAKKAFHTMSKDFLAFSEHVTAL